MVRVGLTVVGFLAVLGCKSGGSSTVYVELETDFVAVEEFDEIAIELTAAGGTDRDFEMRPENPELASGPYRVAVFEDVPLGMARIRIGLRRSGAFVAEAAVQDLLDEANEGFVVRIPRSCEGLDCHDDETCSAGQCVPLDCSDCPAECGSSDPCAASAGGCSEGVCIEGQCLQRLLPDACESDEYCHPTEGCRTGLASADAGISDSGFALSDNAALASLTISEGELSPEFASQTTGYEASVPLGAQSVMVTAVPEDPGATIRIEGVTVDSGEPSAAIPMNLGDNEVSIEVTAPSGAVLEYEVTVTREMLQRAFIKASNTAGENVDGDDRFGCSVAVDGDTLVVGAFLEDYDSVGIDGEAPFEHGSRATSDAEISWQSGAVYVFIRSGDSWEQQAYIKAGNRHRYDQFGASVAIEGNTLVVGAPYENTDATGIDSEAPFDYGTTTLSNYHGAVYVFERTGTTWAQTAYIKEENPEANDQFGSAVELSGNTIVVGDWSEDSNAAGMDQGTTDNAGAAYIFVRNGSVWSQQAFLKAPNATAQDRLGFRVAIDGDIIALHALLEGSNAIGIDTMSPFDFGVRDGTANASSAVYIYERTSGVWNLAAYVKSPDSDANDAFGYGLAVSGTMLAVGASGEEDPGDPTRTGAVYTYSRTAPGVWEWQATLRSSSFGLPCCGIGTSLALEADTLVVGAGDNTNSIGTSNAPNIQYGIDDNTADTSGGAHVFLREGDSWTPSVYLKASNPGPGDQFAYRIAISGGLIVIGGSFEDSNVVGIDNGSPFEHGSDVTSENDSGAVYVFE